MRVVFDWGLAGARALAGQVEALVVVDVLSFSTAVDVACGRGAGLSRRAPRSGGATFWLYPSAASP